MAIALFGFPTPAGAQQGLGDFLGNLLGGGGSNQPQPAPPQSPPPPQQPQPVTPIGILTPAGGQQPPGDPLLAPESSCPGQSNPGLAPPALEQVMVCMESYARVAQGLSALRAYGPLQVSATHRAREIRRCESFHHNPCGRSFGQWIGRMHPIKGRWRAGEILAFGGKKSETVRATMASWLASAEHRAVLLRPCYDLVGVGTTAGRFLGRNGMRIWVSHLGCRR